MLTRDNFKKKLNQLKQDFKKSPNAIFLFEEEIWSLVEMTAPMNLWTIEHFLIVAVLFNPGSTIIDRLQGKRVIPHEYIPYLVSENVEIQNCDLIIMTSLPTVENLPHGINNTYVLAQKSSDFSDLELYFIERRFDPIHIIKLDFAKNKRIDNFLKEIFPHINDFIYPDISNIDSKQQEVITKYTNHRPIENERIYIRRKEDKLHYVVRSKDNQIISDEISERELKYKLDKPLTRKILDHIIQEILDITYKRRHTFHNLYNKINYTIHYKYLNNPEDIDQVANEILSDLDTTITYWETSKRTSSQKYLSPFKLFEECNIPEPTLGIYDIHSQPINKKRLTVDRKIKIILLSSHYKLDLNKILNNEKNTLGTRLKIKSAAEILGIDEENVIAVCQSKKIGVYYKENDFNIKRYSSFHTSIVEINEKANPNYEYPYLGLVRLSNHELTRFFVGNSIRCKSNHQSEKIHLQISLAELINGINHAEIELGFNQTIDLKQCIVFEEELKTHKKLPEKADINDKKNSPPRTRKHLLKEVIEKAYKGEKGKLKKEPTAIEVWNALRAEPHVAPCHLKTDSFPKKPNALYDQDEIIQEMDDRELGWRNRDNKDKKLLFTSFETKLSKIKKQL